MPLLVGQRSGFQACLQRECFASFAFSSSFKHYLSSESGPQLFPLIHFTMLCLFDISHEDCSS